MLTRITPAEVILALRPLLQNTPRSPRGANTPAKIETAADVEAYLRDVYERAEWFTCACGRVWNCLTEEGICITCVDQRVADANRQVKLGEYLKKTIGPYGLEHYSFDRFQVTDKNKMAFQRCRDFNPTTDNLFIFGPCGTGKTHLAGAILKQTCAQNLTVKWANPMYVSRAIRSRFPSEEEAFVEDLLAHQVLIVDDLG